jgi:hypothetical protein
MRIKFCIDSVSKDGRLLKLPEMSVKNTKIYKKIQFWLNCRNSVSTIIKDRSLLIRIEKLIVFQETINS